VQGDLRDTSRIDEVKVLSRDGDKIPLRLINVPIQVGNMQISSDMKWLMRFKMLLRDCGEARLGVEIISKGISKLRFVP
jgi:hypothetical protein